jgi:hypothetical protein
MNCAVDIVMLALQVFVPRPDVTVMVYGVGTFTVTFVDPLVVETLPMLLSIEALVAFVVVQASILVPPAAIEGGDAVSIHAGAGV